MNCPLSLQALSKNYIVNYHKYVCLGLLSRNSVQFISLQFISVHVIPDLVKLAHNFI